MDQFEVCPEGCDPNLKRVDLHEGITVCISCGMVLGTVIEDRFEGNLGEDRGENATKMRTSGPARHNIAKTMFGMEHMTVHMSKKTAECKATIESIARILCFPVPLIGQCHELLYRTDIKQLNPMAFASAIVYYISRKSQHPRTAREILGITLVARKTFKTALKRIENREKRALREQMEKMKALGGGRREASEKKEVKKKKEEVAVVRSGSLLRDRANMPNTRGDSKKKSPN